MELLISLTIMAVVVSICSSAFKLGFMSVEKEEDKQDFLRFVSVVELIENQLNSLCLKKKCSFSGTEKELLFDSCYSVVNQRDAEIVEVTLRAAAEEREEKIILEIRERAAFPLYSEPEDPGFIPLLAELDAVSFEYLDAVSGSEKKWTKKWDNDTKLPLAVKVVVSYSGTPVTIISKILNPDKKY